MNSRELMAAALQGQPVSRLAVAPLYLHLYLAEKARCLALAGYRTWMGNRQDMRVEPERVASIQIEALRQAWEWLGETPDWIWTRQLPPADWLAECILRQEGKRLWMIHKPSRERDELSNLFVASDSTEDRWDNPLPHSRSEVDSLVSVRPAEELLSSGRLDIARGLLAKLGKSVFVCGTMGSPFWTCYSILGFQGLMTMPLDQPELLHYMLQRQTERLLALANAYAAVGVHGVFVEECLTSADLISTSIYDEFVLPYDRALLTELRALSLPSVLYVCGDVSPRLSRLAELAPTALAVEESKKGFRIDLAEVASAVGKQMTVFGNLDATQVKQWDDSEMARQIAGQVLAARPARGFIASIGSPFPLDTPRQRVAALIAAARAASLAG